MTGPPDSWIESEANGGICDDAGECHQCGEHLDSGRCVCLRCEDCGEYLDPEHAITITVPHIKTKQPVRIRICERCAEKREPKPPLFADLLAPVWDGPTRS